MPADPRTVLWAPRVIRLFKRLISSLRRRLSPNRMKSEVVFSAVSLEGDPRDLEKGPVNLKLFFESRSENRELFTNIDLKMRRLYVSEKDPEYREAIIKALRTS